MWNVPRSLGLNKSVVRKGRRRSRLVVSVDDVVRC